MRPRVTSVLRWSEVALNLCDSITHDLDQDRGPSADGNRAIARLLELKVIGSFAHQSKAIWGVPGLHSLRVPNTPIGRFQTHTKMPVVGVTSTMRLQNDLSETIVLGSEVRHRAGRDDDLVSSRDGGYGKWLLLPGARRARGPAA